MPLALDDGYTIPFATGPGLRDSAGNVVEPVAGQITGRYRPPVLADTEEYRYRMTRAQSGTERAAVLAKFIADRVTDWDVTLKGSPLPLTPDAIAKHLPAVFAELVFEEVRQWRPASQDAAAGNS